MISEGQYIIPRTLRNSFLVSLLTLYESITADIAGHIKEGKGKTLSIKDIKGAMVDSTKKYYDDVVGFQLSKSEDGLKKLEGIVKLRNFIVHENGCFLYCSSQKRNDILGTNEGVENQDGYVLLSKDLLSDAFRLVKNELEDLMERYTNWKISHR